MHISEALDRIRAAGVTLRVEGTSLKASGVALTEGQRAFLRAHKLAIISEIECPSRCDCGKGVDIYGLTEDGSALVPYCEGHAPTGLRAELWPGEAATEW